MKNIYLFASFLLLILGTQPALSQTVTVTVPVDGLVGSLRYTVNNALPGDTILFSALTNNTNVNVSQGEIIIDKRLTFIGNDTTATTVQGKGSHIFRITSADTVSFVGIRFINASDDTLGGAMQADSTRLFFSQCSFDSNSAVSTGGALYLSNSNVDIDSCSFTNNKAYGRVVKTGGGAIANVNSELVISATYFANNGADSLAGSGGAILNLDGGNTTINDCVFEKNTASRAGGAIEGNSGAGTLITLNNSTLDSNTAGAAPGNGGALHITGAGDVIVNGGSFTGNYASAEGGALWNGAGTMTVNGTVISGNIAEGAAADQGGGGIYNLSGTLNVNGGAILVENHATGVSGSGGGILNDAGATLNIDGAVITKNTSNRAGGGIEDNSGAATTMTLVNLNLDSNITNTSPGNGGGLHITGPGNAVITGGTANGNSAGQEGGAFWNGSGTMTITGTAIDGNSVQGIKSDDGGAGVFNNGGTLNILDGTTITNNVAPNGSASGGGLLSTNGVVTITNATLNNNAAKRAGGAIEIIKGELTATNVTMLNNDVNGLVGQALPGNGGAVHVTDTANTTFMGGLISGNLAAREGGALWNQAGGTMTVGGGLVISKNKAFGDAADDGGAGIFNNGGALVLNDAIIDSNDAVGAAGSGGGVLNVSGGTITGTGVVITNNTSVRAGGGIEDAANASINLVNATIDGNTTAMSPGNGGGIHVTGSTSVTLQGGSVSGNIASSEGGGLWNGTGIMNLSGVTVDGNTASGNAANEGGGGIYNLRGTVITQNNTIISNNIADGTSGSGGGILNDSAATLVLNNTTISGNSASRAGGGIEDNSGPTTAISLFFVDFMANTTGATPGNGGALHITGAGSAEIVGGTASGNIAEAEGGAFWNGAGTMVIDSVLITNNEAKGAGADQGGGAIYNLSGTLQVQNATVIQGNIASGAAGSGGGILNDVGGTLTVQQTTFEGNTAVRAGGAIEDNSKAGTTVLLSEVTMNNNIASAAPGNGGAVHITGDGDLTIVDSEINGNTAAAEGGGLWNGAGTMIVANVSFEGNKASGIDANQGGGAIYNLSGDLFVTSNSVFTNNVADGTSGSGGAILNDVGATLGVDSSVFVGNTASRAGGAIEDNSQTAEEVNIGNSTFLANSAGSAPGNGGAIHISGAGNMNVALCVFEGNIAAREGGALWNNTGVMNVIQTSITGNLANGANSDDGGAGIFNNGGTLMVFQSTLDANRAAGAAGSGGGILNVADGSLTVIASTLSGNMASQGAGIGSFGELVLSNSTVVNNVASGNGGGIIHISDQATTIKSNIIAQNQATSGKDVAVAMGAMLQSAGYNLIGEDDASVFPALATDIEGASGSPIDPLINDTLALNGGVTKTHAIVCASPAYNKGDAADASDDQRGLAVFNGTRDIGAYELQDSCIVDGIFDASANQSVSYIMYPNPVSGNEVTIQLATGEKATAELFDLSGKLIHIAQSENEILRISLRGISSGTYLMKVSNTKGVGVQKLIIQ